MNYDDAAEVNDTTPQAPLAKEEVVGKKTSRNTDSLGDKVQSQVRSPVQI